MDMVIAMLLLFTYAMRRFEVLADRHERSLISKEEVEQFLREVREL